MENRHKTGLLGQQTAAAFLQKKGHEILAHNFRKQTGEVDLVSKDGGYIVFTEVKARTGLGYGLPKEAVGAAKQKRIADTAVHYLTLHNLTESDIRFDVVEVLMHEEKVYISHIENAFSIR